MATLVVTGLLLACRRLLRGRHLLLRVLARLLGACIHFRLQAALPFVGIRDTLQSRLKVLRSALAGDAEPVQRGLVEVDLGREHNVLRVALQEQVG